VPRDYQRRANPKGRKPPPRTRRPLGILPFLSGLSLGLFVAFITYLHEHDAPPPAQASNSRLQAAGTPDPKTDIASRTEATDKPHFDFYTILPEREVKVPEWEIDQHQETVEKDISAATYLLQVGSFQRYQDADRVKAKLALLGIKAEIQRVVINGQDVWFRVRIGPFREMQALNHTRAELADNGMNSMLLRIKPGAE